jgi:putative hemolysin
MKGQYDMSDGYPAETNQGLFSNLKKAFLKKVKSDKVTEEEIIDMVNEGHESGVLKENEAEMINNIFEFGEKQAHDIMTHRKSIVAINCNVTVEEAFQFILDENFSRYPVYEDSIDNVIGILHIRDLLKVYVDESMRSKKLLEIKEQVLFEAYCIPETRNISVLFKEMQAEKVHIAIVVDEYGQTTGIVTMEDILEEIVGNILDEYDDEQELISKQPDGTYIIKGQTTLEEIEDILDIKFDCEDIDTINGYLIYKLGKIPEDNEQFETECEGYIFQVLSVENKMISLVKVRKK